MSGSAGSGGSSDSPGSVSANSPTMMPPTVNGTLLGTLAYMSPEQARGKNVDKRTDIWAFGCVLYEMLTGRAAFAGETDGDVLVATLDREPDWILLPANLAFNIRRLLQRFHPVISPDGRWPAMPLADGAASNLWLLSTEDGSMRPVTDFGDYATLIARRMSWSPDGQCLYMRPSPSWTPT